MNSKTREASRNQDSRIPRPVLSVLCIGWLLLAVSGCVTTGSDRVEYYERMVLEQGWRPVGRGRVAKEDVHKYGSPIYRFEYRKGELDAVHETGPCGRQMVYGKAFVLHPEESPFGAGPFVIGPSADKPRYGRNFLTDERGCEYHARIDKNGNLSRYDVSRCNEEGGKDTTKFRCTYNEQGLLARLEVIGKNEMEDIFPDERREFAYDERGLVVFEAGYGSDDSWAMLHHYGEEGGVHKTVLERLPDGTYRVHSSRRDPEGTTGWMRVREVPAEFRKYIEELPIPGKGE